MNRDDEGFTLIEALVALLILGIASVGLVRAAEAHVDSVRALELRTAAGFVASNRLVELGLPRVGRTSGAEEEMLGRRWRVAATEKPTDDPDLRAVRVSVTPAGASAPLVSLDGFVDRGGAP